MSRFTPIDEELHRYLIDHGARQDEALARIERETRAMGDVSEMQVAPDQGAFITLLCRLIGAREALELGTFTGYSAICIARGLEPGGRLLACELSEEYARIAAANFEEAGVAERIEIRIGRAADTVRALPERQLFDFAFIDADKPGYPDYWELVVPRMRPGGLVMVDNALYGGRVVPGHGEGRPESIEGIRRTNEIARDDERVDIAMVAVADGLMLARRR